MPSSHDHFSGDSLPTGLSIPPWLDEVVHRAERLKSWNQYRGELRREVYKQLESAGKRHFMDLDQDAQDALLSGVHNRLRDQTVGEGLLGDVGKLLDSALVPEIERRFAGCSDEDKLGLLLKVSAEGGADLLSQCPRVDRDFLRGVVGKVLPDILRYQLWKIFLVDGRARREIETVIVDPNLEIRALEDLQSIIARLFHDTERAKLHDGLLLEAKRLVCARNASRGVYDFASLHAAIGVVASLANAGADMGDLAERYTGVLRTVVPLLGMPQLGEKAGDDSVCLAKTVLRAIDTAPDGDYNQAEFPLAGLVKAADVAMNALAEHDAELLQLLIAVGSQPLNLEEEGKEKPSSGGRLSTRVTQEQMAMLTVLAPLARRLFVGHVPLDTTSFIWDVLVLATGKNGRGLLPALAVVMASIFSALGDSLKSFLQEKKDSSGTSCDELLGWALLALRHIHPKKLESAMAPYLRRLLDVTGITAMLPALGSTWTPDETELAAPKNQYRLQVQFQFVISIPMSGLGALKI